MTEGDKSTFTRRAFLAGGGAAAVAAVVTRHSWLPYAESAIHNSDDVEPEIYFGVRKPGSETSPNPVPSPSTSPSAAPSHTAPAPQPQPHPKPPVRHEPKPVHHPPRSFHIGPDVSQFNRPKYDHRFVNYEALASAGISFAICRAGYILPAKGGPTLDPDFRENRARIHDAGLLPGLYYFLRSNGGSRTSGIRQAKHFLELIHETDPRIRAHRDKRIPALIGVDFEHSPSDHTIANRAVVSGFMEYMDAQTSGHPLYVYASAAIWNPVIGNLRMPRGAFQELARWPHIGGNRDPIRMARRLPHPGSAGFPHGGNDLAGFGNNLFLWQYTDAAHIPGHTHPFDFNVSFKTWAEILAKAGMSENEVRYPQPLAKHL